MDKFNSDNHTFGRDPFKVPEGYFDNFASRMMERIPQEQPSVELPRRVSWWRSEKFAKVKPYLYLAATFCGLYFGMWVYNYQKNLYAEYNKVAAVEHVNDSERTIGSADTQDDYDDYVNDACDYMMTDSHDIIACLVENE